MFNIKRLKEICLEKTPDLVNKGNNYPFRNTQKIAPNAEQGFMKKT